MRLGTVRVLQLLFKAASARRTTPSAPASARLPRRLTPSSASVAFPTASTQLFAIPAALAVTADPFPAATAATFAVAATIASLTTAVESVAAARNTCSERCREGGREGREGRAKRLKDGAGERGATADTKANFDTCREVSACIASRLLTRSGCRCCRRNSGTPRGAALLLLCAVVPFWHLGTDRHPEAGLWRP